MLEDLAPVGIGADEGAALREWVRREGARRTVETGLGFAVSTLFICEGLLANGGEIRHVAIDPFQFETPPGSPTTYAGVGVATLKEAGVRNLVELHVERAHGRSASTSARNSTSSIGDASSGYGKGQPGFGSRSYRGMTCVCRCGIEFPSVS